MSYIDRRTFIAATGGAATLALLPLAGCGGGSEDEAPPVSVLQTAASPMRAPVSGAPQFQVFSRAHSLGIIGGDGKQRRYGGVGRAKGKLNYPASVAVLNRLAYVVETGNHRVQVFDVNGNSLGLIGEGELRYPGGIVAGQKEILVADSRHARIVGFTVDGRVKRVIGAGILSAPQGVAVQGTQILVADAGLRKVLKFGSDGRLMGELGTGWVLPWGVATDGKNAYVADAARKEIGVMSLSGKRLPSLKLGFSPSNVAFQNGALQVTPQG